MRFTMWFSASILAGVPLSSGFTAAPGVARATVKKYPASFKSIPTFTGSRSSLFQSSDNADATKDEPEPDDASKREMIRFALPALGIFLSNPLLSNIDNAFVAHTVGTTGLAALSPATLCTDQMIYLFAFLARATTGMVARVYGKKQQSKQEQEEAVRTAASTPLTVALVSGLCLSGFYALGTPSLLRFLRVNPSLQPAAAAYILWRGSITWAALAQMVCLATLLATRDSITPLKIVSLAALVNVGCDALFCVWPWRMGCAGAAAATALATLISCTFMLRGLARKNILPRIQRPSKDDLWSLGEFMGPILAITLTRIGGFVSMQRAAMRLGVESLAGFQLSSNLLFFFLLFGEPLSQLSQTKLPALLDEKNGPAVLANLKSILTIAGFAAMMVAVFASGAAFFGSPAISSDVAVQTMTRSCAPALFSSIAVGIFATAVDGALLASRDFGFMVALSIGSYALQLQLLSQCRSISQVFYTFPARLGFYAAVAIVRAALGRGAIGRVLRHKKQTSN